VHQNASKSGRPKSASRNEIVSKIKNIIEDDARFTVRDITRKVGISLSTIHFILKKHLKVRKISARWVPHLLTDEQKRKRVKVAKKLLQMFPKYDKNSLPMSSQVIKLGPIILGPSEKLATKSGPLNTTNAQ
jgi:histone-lysine N-methyltransferase SETMAR